MNEPTLDDFWQDLEKFFSNINTGGSGSTPGYGMQPYQYPVQADPLKDALNFLSNPIVIVGGFVLLYFLLKK